MKKIIERILVFVIGVPAFAALVLFLPHFNNLALNLVVVFFSVVGAIEFSNMLEKKQIKIPKIEGAILGSLFPVSFTLMISFDIPGWILLALCMAGFCWALLSKVFSRRAQIENIAMQIVGRFSLIIYPGLFICWIIFMSVWQNSGAILLFLFITFGNDSLAWLFGTLFGANNRGIISVSPNKSIAGFIGGIVGSILVAVAAMLFFPEIFVHVFNYSHDCTHAINNFSFIMILKSAALGFFTGVAAMLGDLAESAIKRSCDFKDSGNFMLGRGGVLDSIDSIAVASPAFFILFIMLFL